MICLRPAHRAEPWEAASGAGYGTRPAAFGDGYDPKFVAGTTTAGSGNDGAAGGATGSGALI